MQEPHMTTGKQFYIMVFSLILIYHELSNKLKKRF